MLCKTNSCQAQLCHADCGSAQLWPRLMSTHTLFFFTWELHPSPGGLSLTLCLPVGSLRAPAARPSFAQGCFSGVLPVHWSSCGFSGCSLQAQWDTPAVGQPVPGHKSVCPGAKGPVWRLREHLLDDGGGVGGCDIAWQRGLSCLS